MEKPIKILENVKDVNIDDVPAGALVGGVPAHIIREKVEWEK